MSKNIYVGAVGTEIVLNTFTDLTTASTTKIRYRRPDFVEGEWPATVFETTKVRYITQADDIAPSGVWTLQAYVELPDWEGLGSSAPMTVLDEWA